MKNFDFFHVQIMMNWNWSRIDYNDEGIIMGSHKWEILNHESKEYKVPSVEELKKLAEGLLKDVINHVNKQHRVSYYQIATGPFKITYHYKVLTLECIFENWGYV
jgi:hypothetical protein